MTRASAANHFLAAVEAILAEHHERVAALVVEPLVQAAAGMLMHPPGFLRGLRELCTRYQVLLIGDEVAVGFGRTGTMFACQHEGVSPDFLCLAKGLTAGYLPLAATLATEEVWRAFLGEYAESKTFFHGHTYCGNPLGAAVALASLDVFEEERTLESLAPKIERIARHLKRIGSLPHVGDTRQRGMIAAVELVEDQATRQPTHGHSAVASTSAAERANSACCCDHSATSSSLCPPWPSRWRSWTAFCWPSRTASCRRPRIDRPRGASGTA